MNKSEIIINVAKKSKCTKKLTTIVVENLLKEIEMNLRKGEKVILTGFGTFRKKRFVAKPVLIPFTNKKVVVPAHNSIRFKTGLTLKKAVK